MSKNTKLFIIIGIVALVLGMGTGFLIKAVKKDAPEDVIETQADIEVRSDIVELPVMSNEANPQRKGAVPKPPEDIPASNDVMFEDAEDPQGNQPDEDETENDRDNAHMNERRYND